MNHLAYLSQAETRINNRGLNKPNEDLYFIDPDHHIFILLDGITRVHKEYEQWPGKSAALEVGKIFLSAASAYLQKNINAADPIHLLRQAAIVANSEIAPYRQRRTQEEWQFYPAVLGILSILRGNTLYYVYLGDCLGLHIHAGKKRFFGCQPQIELVNRQQPSKAERYALYVNHPGNPLAYGIFNGDKEMEELLDQGTLTLCQGDTLILVSDGLSHYLHNTEADILSAQPVNEILGASEIYDIPPYASYADDKAIIKLTF